MLQKLKSVVGITVFGLALAGMGLFGFVGRAAAGGATVQFACADGSTNIDVAKAAKVKVPFSSPNGTPTQTTVNGVVVSCQSKATVVYPSTNGLQPVAYAIACSGSESFGSQIKGSQYIFYCVHAGATENAGSSPASDAPVITEAQVAQSTCKDGTTVQGDVSNCPSPVDPAANGGNCASLSNCDLIAQYINPFINLLSVLVGVAVVISIIIGGIQYASSGGDSQQVTAAKARIRNAIIALLTFLFLYALLNFLIPGGLL